MPIIRCMVEELYARQLATIMVTNVNLGGAAPVTHSLGHVTFSSPYDTLQFLTSFGYCRK